MEEAILPINIPVQSIYQLFAQQRGGLGKQIGYSARSGANNRSSGAIRPAAGWTREAVMLFAPQLGE